MYFNFFIKFLLKHNIWRTILSLNKMCAYTSPLHLHLRHIFVFSGSNQSFRQLTGITFTPFSVVNAIGAVPQMIISADGSLYTECGCSGFFNKWSEKFISTVKRARWILVLHLFPLPKMLHLVFYFTHLKKLVLICFYLTWAIGMILYPCFLAEYNFS